MNCPNCDNDWWIEEKAIRLAAMPSPDPRLTSVPCAALYRLRCAGCSFIYGTEPTINKTNANQKDQPGERSNRLDKRKQ